MDKRRWLVCLAVALLVAASALVRAPREEVGYRNEDATWHVLLTVTAYDETPKSQHLFLPIVSLGGQADKGIPWGGTIPDAQGNYYYTSFSPAAFFVAWAFIRLFGLPVSEGSLYLLNSVLLAISALVLVWLLSCVYARSRFRDALCLVGGVAYACLPEVLHGMGVVYWAQSLMQVTLILQVLAYYEYAVEGRGAAWRALFYALAVANPYIEWTGYVANVGFALAELTRGWRDGRPARLRGLGRAAVLGLLTLASFGLLCAHYLLRVDAGAFFSSLLERSGARGASGTGVGAPDLLAGYLSSFSWLWALLGALLVMACVLRRGLPSVGQGALLFVTAFPVLENVLMMQHATSYTYDRMKAAFVLVLVTCELARNVMEASRGRGPRLAVAALVAACSALNVAAYVTDRSSVWDTDYRADNEAIAAAVTERYPNALYASNRGVRGYMNLLFHRGIFEGATVDVAREIAAGRGCDRVVFLETDPLAVEEVRVYDTASGELVETLDVEGGEVTVS